MEFENRELAKRWCVENGVPLGRMSAEDLLALDDEQRLARLDALRHWSHDSLSDRAKGWFESAIANDLAVQELEESA